MKLNLREIPRRFFVGSNSNIEIKDLGEIYLDKDEQVTFLTKDKKRHDFARKDWGFYATPSINGRLKNEGFLTALVRNKKNQIYIMVVDKDKKDLFFKYCKEENQKVIQWLSDYPLNRMKAERAILKCDCNHENKQKLFEYNKRPEGETNFKIPEDLYFRSYSQCKLCKHCFSEHSINLDKIYESDYVDSTYGGSINEKFRKIISLPPDKSDNNLRVSRIKDFSKYFFNDQPGLNLLDIGSGLGVFPYLVKKIGWECLAIDPDHRTVKHLKDNLNINAIKGDIFDLEIDQKFDIITLNKVLEHVYEPVEMLIKAASMLKNNGFIYIEVPDAEEAAKKGSNREEFFIEHHHVFSMMSLNLMVKSASLITLRIERVIEPSGKFTLFAFLKNN